MKNFRGEERGRDTEGETERAGGLSLFAAKRTFRSASKRIFEEFKKIKANKLGRTKNIKQANIKR